MCSHRNRKHIGDGRYVCKDCGMTGCISPTLNWFWNDGQVWRREDVATGKK